MCLYVADFFFYPCLDNILSGQEKTKRELTTTPSLEKLVRSQRRRRRPNFFLSRPAIVRIVPFIFRDRFNYCPGLLLGCPDGGSCLRPGPTCPIGTLALLLLLLLEPLTGIKDKLFIHFRPEEEGSFSEFDALMLLLLLP